MNIYFTIINSGIKFQIYRKPIENVSKCHDLNQNCFKNQKTIKIYRVFYFKIQNRRISGENGNISGETRTDRKMKLLPEYHFDTPNIL